MKTQIELAREGVITNQMKKFRTIPTDTIRSSEGSVTG